MRGRQYSTDGTLPERDLHELTDLLALRLYQKLGQRAYRLTRQDVAELIRPFTGDLARDDQRALPWMVWDLLQEGMEIEFQMR
ncbi:MAG TPA: hypothetical protein VF909_14750 [Roseiflexaceae bacterium]